MMNAATSVLFAPRKAVQTEVAPKVISRLQEINDHPGKHIFIHGKCLEGDTTLPSEPVKYLVLADISGSNDGAAAGLPRLPIPGDRPAQRILSPVRPGGESAASAPGLLGTADESSALVANQTGSVRYGNESGLDDGCDLTPDGAVHTADPVGWRDFQLPHLLCVSAQWRIGSDGELPRHVCAVSEHTQANTKTSVERQLTGSSSSRANAIPFEFVHDRKGRALRPMVRTIREWQSSSCYAVPEDHLVWNDLIFSERITQSFDWPSCSGRMLGCRSTSRSSWSRSGRC